MLRNTTRYILLAISFFVSVPVIAAVPVIDRVIDQRAAQGSTYQFTPTLSAGGTVNWSKAYGPDDININPSTGSVSWEIPADLPSESFHFGVTASNSDGVATETWVLTVGTGRRLYFNHTQGTLKDAMASMVSGDTLIIRNGLIDGSNRDNLIPGNSVKSQQPPGGSATAYTTLIAEDPGQVTFDMKGLQKYGFHINGTYLHPDWGSASDIVVTIPRDYIAIKGMIFKQSTSAGVRIERARHIKLIDLGVVDAGRNDKPEANSHNVANLYVWRSENVLVEGLYSWGHSRYKMQFKDSINSIVRRSIGRIDEYRGDQPIGGYQFYCSKNITGQNNILVDSNQVDFWTNTKNIAGSFSAAATNCYAYPEGLEHHRSISLNTSISLIDGFAQENPKVPTVHAKDLIGWDFKLDRFSHGTGNQLHLIHAVGNMTLTQGTFGNIDTTIPYGTDQGGRGFIYSRTDVETITNSIMHNFGFDGTTVQNIGPLAWSASGNNLTLSNNTVFGFLGDYTYGSAVFDSTNTTNVDPTENGLRYLPKLEDESLLLTAGENSSRTGAHVMTFLGKSGKHYNEAGGTEESNAPMWPFPHERLIREKMRAYSYTGTTRDGTTKTLYGNRGYTVEGQTLTNYIWTYLGNIPPAFNVTSIAGNNSIELRWDPIADISKSDIDGYKIYEVSTGSRNLMATVGLDTYNHKLTGLTNGENYTFEVVSYNNTQESTYSYKVTNSPTALSRIIPLMVSIQ